MIKISTKLYNFHSKIKAIEKSSVNPFFNSNYFDINKVLEVITPILQECKLVVTQPIIITDGKSALATIIVDIESGEKIESTILLPENLEPQKMGSAITYFRRYALQSILSLRAEDDDAEITKPKPKQEYSPHYEDLAKTDVSHVDYKKKEKSEYGQCKDCNADIVKNPRTGKTFCSNKCWLKASPTIPESPDF